MSADSKKGSNKSNLFTYVKGLLPPTAEIDYIFKEDFNGDGQPEVIVIYKNPDESYYSNTYVRYVYPEKDDYRQILILSTSEDIQSLYYGTGICTQAYAADTDGDGKLELILGLMTGNGGFITVYAFHWANNRPSLFWTTDTSADGEILVKDTDDDGIYEIITEQRGDDPDLISATEAAHHMRESFIYKWDGSSYTARPHPLMRMKDEAFNTSVTFLDALVREDYAKAYDLALLPTIMKIEGLHKYGLKGFEHFCKHKIRPILMQNLQKGPLDQQESFTSYCSFFGQDHHFLLNLTVHQNRLKIREVAIYNVAK